MDSAVETARPSAASAGFFATRWRGGIPVGRLFWMDMLLYGTAVNIVASLGALLMFAAGVPAAVAIAVYFSPLPYNAFLFAAVWRAADTAREPWSSLARAAAFLWLLAATLI